MPRAGYTFIALEGHPGIRISEKGTRYEVRFQQNGDRKSRYFGTLGEALAFRAARGMDKRSAAATAASLANLRTAPNAPPLQNGRAHRVIHGGKAKVTEQELAAKVEEVLEVLAQDLPVQAQGGGVPGADRVVVEQLAETLVRRERVTTYEREHGLLDKKGRVRPASKYGLDLDGQVLRLCDSLGLNPRARATLGLQMVIGKAVVGGLDLLGDRNPIDIDSRSRRAAARALLGIGDQHHDVVEGHATEHDD